jgi:hypothetical protein
MRQAVAKMMVGVCLVLSPPARGDGSPAADEAPSARARRLIQAGDRAGAVTLLEDALIDGPAGDKPAVLDLLRQSYQAMAREAEAAGRAADAAQYRDNLSILDRARETARSRTESPEPRAATPEPRAATPEPRTAPAPEPQTAPAPEPRTAPAPVPARPQAPKEAGPTAPPAPEASPAPPVRVTPPDPSGPPALLTPTPALGLAEPAPLPEPPKVPIPGPVPQVPAGGTTGRGMSRAPGTTASPDATRDGTLEIPTNRPARLDPASDTDGPDGGEALINPGAATGVAAPVPSGAGAGAGTARPGAGGAIAAGVPVIRTPAAPAGLDEADRLFRAQRFDESGRIYAALAARNQLPTDRRPHWAYCRYKAVVRRINARPGSAREWDEIEAEIRSIQRLTPGLWYGEYLLNKVAEARRTRRRPAAASDSLIVRGSAPEEPAPPSQAQAPARRRLFGRSRGPAPAQASNPAEGLPVAPAPDQTLNLPGGLARTDGPPAVDPDAGVRPAEDADDDPKTGSPPASVGSAAKTQVEDTIPQAPGARESADSAPIPWHIHETSNFRIYHCDPALAERAAAVAEAARTAQAKRWGSPATRTPWSPRCELYLYPTARSYAAATGQPEMSPGVSTMSNNGVRVLSRRMNLRVDNPLLLTTTLPHEVTHIVLADLFVVQTIPRWADEGIAVLAEPAAERHHRQADLKEPLDSGHVFKVGQLMKMDYPDPKDWRLFYAQSVSLTQFLVEQGPPERFIQFVHDSQRKGEEAALRDVYRIDGLAALQERWLDYARKHIAVDIASGRDSETAPAGVSRD